MKVLLYSLFVLLIFVASLWPIGLFASAFAFDAPGSEKNLLLIAIFVSILTYPLTAIYGMVKFWNNRSDTNNFNLFKILSIGYSGPLLVVSLMYVFIVVCDGQTVCN